MARRCASVRADNIVGIVGSLDAVMKNNTVLPPPMALEARIVAQVEAVGNV